MTNAQAIKQLKEKAFAEIKEIASKPENAKKAIRLRLYDGKKKIIDQSVLNIAGTDVLTKKGNIAPLTKSEVAALASYLGDPNVKKPMLNIDVTKAIALY